MAGLASRTNIGRRLCCPIPKPVCQARFSAADLGSRKSYQADYLLDQQTVQPGSTITAQARLFAGAKEVSTVDNYDRKLGLNRFELLIDWGWFYFITKPLFWMIDELFKLLKNFGLAILAVTVIIKIVFFPLANKSYASMAKMKSVQPQIVAAASFSTSSTSAPGPGRRPGQARQRFARRRQRAKRCRNPRGKSRG